MFTNHAEPSAVVVGHDWGASVTYSAAHRPATGAVKQLHAELGLEVGQGLADNRLGAAQLAAGGREAALIGGGDEGAQLVEGDGVEHDQTYRTER